MDRKTFQTLFLSWENNTETLWLWYTFSDGIHQFNTPHGFYGIFISQNAIIGDNCTIYQQVTIGSNNLKGSKGRGYPVIGNDCLIGVGSATIGNVKIGNNVRIGANAIVIDDVPDNCTVVMNKPIVIQHEEALDNSLLSHLELLSQKEEK